MAAGTAVAFAVMVAGVPGCTIFPGGDPCRNFDVDDENECTDDTCDLDSNGDPYAIHTPVDCDDQVCNPADGECVDCLVAADCDDDDACTIDSCETDFTCAYEDVVCDEGETCVDGECVATCTTDADCDDDLFCTGEETCVAGACVEGPGDPCDAGQTCNEATDTCDDIVVPTELEVTLGDCPTDAVTDDTATLTVDIAGDEGDTQVIEWTVDGSSSFATSNGLDTIDVLIGSGSSTVTVTVTDFDDVDTNGEFDEDVDTLIDTATDTCTFSGIVDVPTIQVSAGADVSPAPTAGAFTNGSTVSYGTLAAPVVTAIGSDSEFPDTEIAYLWEFTSGPTGVAEENVVILNRSSPNLAFNLLPIGSASELQLRSNGGTATLSNVAIPGIYTFTVTASNPDGDAATDTVSIAATPAFQIFTRWDDGGSADDLGAVYSRLAGVNDTDAAATLAVQANALQGLVLKTGQRTNYVTDGDTFNITYTMLARTNGTISFSAKDLDGGATKALNTVTVTANTAATQEVVCIVTGLTVGTYSIQATFSTTSGSTGSLATDAVVHMTSTLPTSLDVNSNIVVAGLGVATSDSTGPSVHGAFEASVLAGNFVKACDLNKDGIAELIVLDNVGGTPAVAYFFTTPAPGTGQIFNSANNEDDGNGGAFFVGTTVAFTVANTNSIFGTTVNGLAGAAAADPAAGDQAFDCDCGDFDGDTNVDLVFGLEDASIGATLGQVTILYHDGSTTHGANYYNYTAGSAAPRGARATIGGPAAGVDGAVDELYFGYSVAVGRVFGSDTVDDIVVGAPGDAGASDAGRIYVYKGSATRYAGDVVASTADVKKSRTGSAADDFFGISVAIGNVTGGTQQDVVVGAPDDSAVGNGLVLVYSNVSTAGAENRSYGGDAAADLFGRRVGVANINNTGAQDIVVSASDQGVGRVYVILDGRSSFTDVGDLTDVPQFAGSAGEELGHLFATGDFDGDGFDDILALADDTGNKAVLVKGSATPLAALTVATTFTNVAGDAVGATPEISGLYDSDNAGFVGFMDVNADAYPDIVLSDTGATVFRAIYGGNR